MLIYPETALEKSGFELLRQRLLRAVKTEPGFDLAETLHPENNPVVVDRMLRETQQMMGILQEDGFLPLEGIKDVRKPLKHARVIESMLSPSALSDVLNVLAASRKLSQYLWKKEQSAHLLADLGASISVLKELEENLSRVVDDLGEIKDSASPALRAIRKRLSQKRSEYRSKIAQIMRRVSADGMAAEDEPSLRNGRITIPLRAEFKRQVNGYIHDVSSTGHTVYMEPAEALHITNDIRDLENEEAKEIEKILKEVTAKIRPHVGEILQNVEIIALLDLIQAKAKMTNDFNGCVPEINTKGQVNLRSVVNPNLFFTRKSKDDVIVPLTLDFDENERILVITGPNAGGKSVALKTVGICSLLMQCGIGIPAKEGSSLPVYSTIFIDLGDDQSIEDDLSTFSSRLKWMRDVLDSVDEKSLLLLDEAGAGTDPEEGSALYTAFLDFVAKKGAKSVVTTHYGNLKVFAHHHPNGVNASMEFDQKKLEPSYIFRKGIPGSSYAFEIARRMGIPNSLLEEARSRLGSGKNKMENLILDLEAQSQKVKEKSDENAREKEKLHRLRAEFEQKLSTLTREKDKLKAQALAEAKKIITDANKTVEKTIEELRVGKATKVAIKHTKKRLQQAEQHIEQKRVEEIEDAPVDVKEKPEIGDFIRLKDGSTMGELLEINANKATILMNGMRVSTQTKNLVKIQAPKPKKEPKFVTEFVAEPSNLGPKIDLRGKRGDEAIAALESYLDEISRSGLSQVEIIHGKGNGILSKLVREYLAGRKEIIRFEFAPYDQGGPGCTLAYFS